MALATQSRTILHAAPAARLIPPSEAGRARAYHLLRSRLVDYRPFTEEIVRHARRYWGRPRLVELWCGTGIPGWDVVSAVPSLDYVGVDPAPAMVREFRHRTVEQSCRRGTVAFVTPVDPASTATSIQALQGTAELVLVCGALQHVSPTPAAGRRSQGAVLGFAANLVRCQGTLFIIEEIFGASAEEQNAFEWAADQAALTGLLADHEALVAELEPLDAGLADVVRRLPTNPALVREVRAVAARDRERYPLPLAAWQRLLSRLGLDVQWSAHPEIPSLYLFTLSRS